MTPHDYINALAWPGNLGSMLACTSRLIPACAAKNLDRVAKRYQVDDHSAKPWLEITVQLHRPAAGCEPLLDAFTVPFDADLAAVARDVHAVAMLLVRKAVYGEATVCGSKVWDASKMTDEPDSSSMFPAEWQAPA